MSWTKMQRDQAEIERLIGTKGMSFADALRIVTGIEAAKYGAMFATDPDWAVELREAWRRRQQLRVVT